mgnify:FL=1|jgi:hypothetical protein
MNFEHLYRVKYNGFVPSLDFYRSVLLQQHSSRDVLHRSQTAIGVKQCSLGQFSRLGERLSLTLQFGMRTIPNEETANPKRRGSSYKCILMLDQE